MSNDRKKHEAGERLKANVKDHLDRQGKQPTDREVQTFVRQVQEDYDRKKK